MEVIVKIRFFSILFAILILLAGCGYPQPTDSQDWEGDSIASTDFPSNKRTSILDSSLLIQENSNNIIGWFGIHHTPTPERAVFYHAVYPGGSFDFTGAEDDITPDNLQPTKKMWGKPQPGFISQTIGFNGRAFPLKRPRWIRDDGSIPFIS